MRGDFVHLAHETQGSTIMSRGVGGGWWGIGVVGGGRDFVCIQESPGNVLMIWLTTEMPVVGQVIKDIN